jgi:NodT family efflux transporter outer membrane factor (OMF) lipoprotein
MRSAVAIVALLLASGCATTPRTPPVYSIILPQSFAYQDAEAAASSAVVADLLPKDAAYTALRTAAAEAPDLAAAVARIVAARALVRGAGAARLPSIDASAGVTGSRGSQAVQPQNPFFDRNQSTFQTGIDASWDLDLFGRLRANQRAAAARLNAATADAAGVRLALDTDIATALIDHRDAAAREAIVERDIADARDLLRLTSIRARAGIVPGFDAVRADALLKDAEARRPPLVAARAEAVGRLVALTGKPTLEVQSMMPAAEARPATGTPPAAVPSILLSQRPDVRAAAMRLVAADQDVAAAAAARFPRLSITGALGLLALAAGDLFDGDALTASLGAGIAGPLLDFGRTGAEIDRTEAVSREAFALYRGAVFRALGEAETGLAALDAAKTRSAALAAQERVDADALSLARERYRLGLSDFLTVVDSQRTLNATRQSAQAARSDIARRAAQLYRALGGIPEIVTAPRP